MSSEWPETEDENREVLNSYIDHIDSHALRFMANYIADEIAGHFPEHPATYRQVMAMGEEVGEFIGAARRFMGAARRNGNFDDMATELADVVITSYVTAAVFDVNLDLVVRGKLHNIIDRGWRNG